MTRTTPSALTVVLLLTWALCTLAPAVADGQDRRIQGHGELRFPQRRQRRHRRQRAQRRLFHDDEPPRNLLRSLQGKKSRTESVSDDEKSLDSDYARFMRDAKVKKMIVQEIDEDDESLVLGGIVISLEDKVLRPLKLSTDGRNVNVYQCISKEVIDNNLVVQVLKRDGVIYSVTQFRLHSSVVISAVPIPGKPKKYATFSTNDWDRERMSQLISDTRLFRPKKDNIFNGGSISDHVNNGGRRLDDDGCTGHRVVRVDIRFDSDFCRAHGGRQGAIDRIYAIVAASNKPYNESPLCMKIETCNVDGFCNDEDEPSDPFRTMVEETTLLCNSVSGNSLADRFRDYIYAPFDAYSHSGQCDTTHLLYGGNYEPPPGVFQSTGCASIGALCDTYAFGVNHVGLHTQNLPAQAAVVAHELGHNVNSDHDTEEGYVMYSLNCIGCSSFSPTSIRVMTAYADLMQLQYPGTCLGFELPETSDTKVTPSPKATPTLSPTSSPTEFFIDFEELPEPTSEPQTMESTKANLCLGVFDSKSTCNKKSSSKCTWRPDKKECWERKDMKCKWFEAESQCIQHGKDCAWLNKECFAPCEDFDKKSDCDDSKYCTWRKTCRARHELKCSKFKDDFRCENHGTFCTWDRGDEKCRNADEPAPGSCAVITSAILCNKDKFDVCTWDYSSDTCRHKVDMTCAEHTKSKSCKKDGIDCSWNSDDSVCEDKN